MKKKTAKKNKKSATAAPKLSKPAIFMVAGAIVVLAAGMVYSMANENSLKQEAVKLEATQVPAAPAAVTQAPQANGAPAAATPDFNRLFKDVDIQQNIPQIDIAEAKMLYDSGKALFIDARGQSEYDVSHIKGALCIPAGEAHTRIPEYKDMLKDKVLVSYCHGAGCHLADKTAYKLFEAGYKKVVIFFGGWPKWEEHKYPEYRKQ